MIRGMILQVAQQQVKDLDHNLLPRKKDSGALGDWIKEAMHKWGIPTITSPFAPDHETQAGFCF